MRWNDLYLAGTGTHLPAGRCTAQEAVAAGLTTEDAVAGHGIRAVRTAAPEETGPVMAASAGRAAVAASGIPAEDFRLVLHGYVGYQGQDLWTPASYVQQETVGGHAPAVEIVQSSNGGLFGVELACSHLAARRDPGAVLVTTGDAFQPPYVDRWSTDDIPHGDGAGAVVVSGSGGFARIRSLVSVGDPSLEKMLRGTRGFRTSPATRVDLRARVGEFFASDEDALDEIGEKVGTMSVRCLETALAEAETDLAGARFFLHPTIEEPTIEFSYYKMLGVDRSRTTYDWALDLGHVGASDHLIGLDHVVREREPRPGDLLVAMGAAAGFVWTTMVIEFL